MENGERGEAMGDLSLFFFLSFFFLLSLARQRDLEEEPPEGASVGRGGNDFLHRRLIVLFRYSYRLVAFKMNQGLPKLVAGNHGVMAGVAGDQKTRGGKRGSAEATTGRVSVPYRQAPLQCRLC